MLREQLQRGHGVALHARLGVVERESRRIAEERRVALPEHRRDDLTSVVGLGELPEIAHRRADGKRRLVAHVLQSERVLREVDAVRVATHTEVDAVRRGRARAVARDAVGAAPPRIRGGGRVLRPCRREEPDEVREPDEVGELGDAVVPAGAVPPVQLERQGDVRRDRAPRQEPRLLEGDAVVLVDAGLASGLAEDREVADAGRVEVGDEAQQRRLAAARGADERDELAGGDVEVDPGEGGHLASGRGEHLPHACGVDGGCGHRISSPRRNRCRVTPMRATPAAATSPMATVPNVGAQGAAGSDEA